MHSFIQPNTHVALRLPSDVVKIVEIIPNTTINIGKFGTFPANLLLGRPYYFTFEILDTDDGKAKVELRVVPAAELHAEALGNDYSTPVDARDDNPTDGVGAEFDIVGDDGAVIMRSNRLTIDDPSKQTLSMEEIEELKKAGTGSGKDIIAKIMASHMALDEKTSFSLAKYTLRKSRKYLKRFTVLPLDVGTLTDYIIEREAHRILELRQESVGLICSWANVHCATSSRHLTAEDGISQIGGGRWLVVDDSGGLVVAALAERMGILYSSVEGNDSEPETNDREPSTLESQHPLDPKPETVDDLSVPSNSTNARSTADTSNDLEDISGGQLQEQITGANSSTPSEPQPRPRKPPRQQIPQMAASTNTLTLLHNNNQPNLAHLKYFSFDSGNPAPAHPLYHNLKSLSWLQLLHPEEDPSYAEPEVISDDVLAGMKSSKRGNYYKKRRRWEKTSRIVNETRRGGFDGLIVASVMDAKSVLRELVPLIRGGGRVVMYSPTVEPLVELCDLYSKDRRAAYVNIQGQREGGVRTNKHVGEGVTGMEEFEEDDDFPINPTLLLAPNIQTARARHWQVLPGRTHPMMTSKGGAEGYLFTATRVLPVEGKVEARGHFRGKKRKTGFETAVQA